MIGRRRFLTALAVGVIAAPLAAPAQPRRMPTIGFLGPPPSAGGLLQAFQQGLRDLGYVEGRNVKIEYRYTDVALEGHIELMRRLAAELIRFEPDVLVVSVTEAALAVRSLTSTIPIVMVSVPDPVAAGLVSSLARPGGNVTGLSRETRELVGKEFQLLKEAVPEAVRIGVLGDPKLALNAAMEDDARKSARSLGLQLTIVEAEATPADLERAFVALEAEHAGAVLVLGGAGFYLKRATIAELALKHRLPSMFQNREFVEAGGLLSYAPSTTANYRRAAFFVDRILKGARPADLPVEQPTEVELVVNVKTASALGLTIPQSVLLRANRVIQ